MLAVEHSTRFGDVYAVNKHRNPDLTIVGVLQGKQEIMESRINDINDYAQEQRLLLSRQIHYRPLKFLDSWSLPMSFLHQKVLLDCLIAEFSDHELTELF
ncbi:MAG: hypothetical protein JNK60_12415 [Acidobacteria bacterium]|nr:hypothetical protein [Acidobacteriota bacterium]